MLADSCQDFDAENKSLGTTTTTTEWLTGNKTYSCGRKFVLLNGWVIPN